MERYLHQLLADIEWARKNVPEPWWNFLPADAEDSPATPWTEDAENAPRKSLELLTGLKQEQLPPVQRLNEHQVLLLLKALKEMLSAYNCHVVFQRTDIPPDIQYEIIRTRFCQEAPQLKLTEYFFSFCDPESDRSRCLLGEFCECRFLDHMLTSFDDPEENNDDLDFQERYLRRKYGHDWENIQQSRDWEEPDEDLKGDEDLDWWDDEED